MQNETFKSWPIPQKEMCILRIAYTEITVAQYCDAGEIIIQWVIQLVPTAACRQPYLEV